MSNQLDQFAIESSGRHESGTVQTRLWIALLVPGDRDPHVQLPRGVVQTRRFDALANRVVPDPRQVE